MPSKEIRSLNFPSWAQIVDCYVACADQVTDHVVRISRSLHRSVKEENFEDLRNSFVLKVTLLGIFVLFGLLLSSCQTGPRRLPLPPPSAHLPAQTSEKGESLYVRRATPQIRPLHEGSETGSIYADSRRPVQLFSDQARPLPGDYLTVVVPTELVFQNPAASAGNEKGPQSAATRPPPGSDRGKTGATDEDLKELLELARAQPEELSALRLLQQQDTGRFKAQIVGIDPDGTAYIKAVREFTTPNGQGSALTLTGRVPLTSITPSGVSATDLTQIELTVLENGMPGLYRAAGWDPVIARKMAGFLPDLKGELDTIRSLEQRIRNQQRNLTDRFRNLRREQGRFKREQGEYYESLRRRQQAEAQAADQRVSGSLAAAPGGPPAPPGSTPADSGAVNPEAPGVATGDGLATAAGTQP